MSTFARTDYTIDGRMRGSYVYMLLCEIGDEVHVKVAHSCDPLRRLGELRNGCPVTPGIIAVAELSSRRIAVQAETHLHYAFAPWHSHLEWFKFRWDQRAEFNAAWKPTLRSFSTPSRPVCWRKYSVPAITAAAQKRKGFIQRQYARSSQAYRDFRAHN